MRDPVILKTMAATRELAHEDARMSSLSIAALYGTEIAQLGQQLLRSFVLMAGTLQRRQRIVFRLTLMVVEDAEAPHAVIAETTA